MQNQTKGLDLIYWVCGMLLVSIGILNLFLVHPVPGIIYLIVSIIFLPPTYLLMHNITKVELPFWVKMTVFVLIMWITLGVGDLAEIFGL